MSRDLLSALGVAETFVVSNKLFIDLALLWSRRIMRFVECLVTLPNCLCSRDAIQRALFKGLGSKDPPQFMPVHRCHVCRFLLKAYHPNCLEFPPLALLFFGLIIQRLLRFQSYTFSQNAMYICVPYFEEYKGRLKF